MGEEPQARRRGSRSLAQLERDAALNRIGRTRKFMIAAAAALTAGVAAVFSSIAPGRTLGAKTGVSGTAATTAATSSAHDAPQMPPLASPAALGLQGPEQAPQSAPSQPVQPQASPAPATPPQPAPQASSGGGVVSGGS